MCNSAVMPGLRCTETVSNVWWLERPTKNEPEWTWAILSATAARSQSKYEREPILSATAARSQSKYEREPILSATAARSQSGMALTGTVQSASKSAYLQSV